MALATMHLLLLQGRSVCYVVLRSEKGGLNRYVGPLVEKRDSRI